VLLGIWAACGRDEASGDEVPRDGVPHDDVPTKNPILDAAAALPAGAWVRVSQQRLLSIPDASASLEIHSEEPFRIAEVVAIEGQFVKLRTIAATPADLCATTRGADPSFEIHFYAELDALEAVLATPKLVELDDGTKLEFAAGVPVELSGPEPTLRLGGASFVVPLAKHEIGWWFPAAPAPALAHVPTASPSSWSQSRPLHYGERSVEPDGPPFVDIDDWRSLDDDNALLTFVSACGRFMLLVEGEVPRGSRSGLYAMKGPKDAIPKMARNFDPDVAARSAGILALVEQECGLVWEAPSGVALTWQDSGKIAGVTRTLAQLPDDAREVEAKHCFTIDDMAVCIASDRLTSKEDPVCVRRKAVFLESPYGAGRSAVVGPSYPDGKVPQVRQLKAQVSPGLDADIVRRIVRAHINELRSCYLHGFAKAPKLAGNITIAFEIGVSGKVSSSSVQASTLAPADEEVPKCFAKAVKRWQFPKPTGRDPISVTYPFELRSE
jgi:hypothetical protein